MDDVAEFAIRVIGTIVREIVEAISTAILRRIGRFIAFVYSGIYRTVHWNLNSNFLAIPITILLMLALGGALFFASVKAIQWVIA